MWGHFILSIARPASKTRVLCTLRQCSPVWRYARARGKFQCAAYSVWCARNFCCTGYSTIINIARTLLTKACKSGFYLIVAFWLCFIFCGRVNMGCSYFFVAEPIQQEVNETAFRDFQHIRCLHLEHTRPNVADVNPTQANAC